MAEVNIAKPKTERTEVSRPDFQGFLMPFFRGGLFGMNPFALMRQFTDEMDRGFNLPAGTKAAFMPAIEVKQKEGKLLVTADLPGLGKDDVKVSIDGDTLVLEGERKQEKEEKREGFFHSERSYGSFYRAVALPEGANLDQASANFANGVLEVTVPIDAAKSKAKQIPVKEAPAAKAA